jgi:hypothetical protein
MTKKILSILFIFALMASTAFAVGINSSIDLERQDIQAGNWGDNTTYSIDTPYVTYDPLFSFVKNGDQIKLNSNCAFMSGCDYYGIWKNTFTLLQNDEKTLDLFYINSSVHTHYQFRIQPTGNVKVYAAHDQCYPSGCQNPPLHLIGAYKKN